jgi:iron(III) transport system ATP-binding protein
VARVDLRGIAKRYPGVTALDEVTLSIEPGEFFTLLGPSGCGKTTLLRTIAGFNSHDAGEVRFDGVRVDTLPAHRRNIGMVYQDYAIFPHKSVGDNVAFGLEVRNVARAEREARVIRALALVQLDGFARRMPHELSGGQQQRVALARAMVINPQILLMDEPLSNLDAKLRLELREDIRDLQKSLGITTVYVTHDQEEALVISDRICVMQGGRVHQVASPREIYARPSTLFVATFVGAMNVFPDLQVASDGTATIERSTILLPGLAGPGRVTLGIRPEDVVVGVAPVAGMLNVPATLEKISYAGSAAFCRLRAGSGLQLSANVYRPDPDALPTVGTTVTATLPLDRLHPFDPGSGARIAQGAR